MSIPYALSNPVCVFLDKQKEDFTRDDLLKIIEAKQIERITFHYTALDGKLKEMQIPIPTRKNAECVLTEGERVDGSSLFKGMVDSGLSDLYVVPMWKTAFINPFDNKSLDFVCKYITAEGELAPYTPDNILIKAAELFKKNTGIELHAFGELEFYLFYTPEQNMYLPLRQRGYHASGPYVKSGRILAEMEREITQIVGSVKYAHSEVGFIERIESQSDELMGKNGEQLEIEFLSTPIEEAGDSLVIAKWLVRNIAARHNMLATFTPKLEDGVAGSGMHVHLKLIKDGKNVSVDKTGSLSAESKKVIGGLCQYADVLTAFGNTVASSYLRLVPNQEAPTQICWSDSNRSAMIRVPLGWSKIKNLASIVNKNKNIEPLEIDSMQTFELRTGDGSAQVHLFLAGIAMAAEWGMTHSEALALAEKLYVKGNIFKDKELAKDLSHLPASCADSADLLLKKREYFERNNIFPESVINYVIHSLQSENDRALHKNLSELMGRNRVMELRRIMHKDIHKN